MLTIPAKPIFPDKASNDRSETTARRRRLLKGNWASDLEDFIQDSVALDRRAIWGPWIHHPTFSNKGVKLWRFFIHGSHPWNRKRECRSRA